MPKPFSESFFESSARFNDTLVFGRNSKLPLPCIFEIKLSNCINTLLLSYAAKSNLNRWVFNNNMEFPAGEKIEEGLTINKVNPEELFKVLWIVNSGILYLLFTAMLE